MMRIPAAMLAGTLIMAPLDAQGADLVVWWQKGYYSQEDEAVGEIVAAFVQGTGKHVELELYGYDDMWDKVHAALEAGQPPDFLFPLFGERSIAQWAHEDRLVDLESALGPVLNLFDADVIETVRILNGRTGRRGIYSLPMGRSSNYVHVWKSLLELAGFTLDDIPKEWEAFWAFWCDQVQPAMRKATGRDDIWGVGLPMSAATLETYDQFLQFQLAYKATWLDASGRLQVDNPEVRDGIVKALENYTSIWRKGCTPPDSVRWTDAENSNNKLFIAQTVVMTSNLTLSIPSAIKRERPVDYYGNVVTIDWPDDVNGQPLVIVDGVPRAVAFKAGKSPALVEDFVRFLVEEGWLAHWLTFAGDRRMPPMRKLLEQPFWLDPSDPHRIRAAMQLLTRRHFTPVYVRDNEWRSGQLIWGENVWGKAVHRVAADGISPEQAVDEAIARIKQILSE